MDISSDMRVFVRVLERGSFAAAARDLGQTPSAVSKLISRLEDRLGVRLLQRTTRRLDLTPEGEIYFTRVRRILAEIDDTEAEVARVRCAPRGRLRVNSGTAFGLHQLADALPDFLVRYPEISVELSLTDRAVGLVEGHADVLIRHGRQPDSALVVRKITDLERTICAAPAYLARRGTPQTPADLARHDCITVSGAPEYHRWPFYTPERIEIMDIAPRIAVDDAEAAVRLGMAGAGIVRLADIIVGEPIGKGLLVPLLTGVHHVEKYPLSAIFLPDRHRLPKVRVFLDFLVERFGDAPWRFTLPREKSPA
ncbi:MAG: LysR family transcriptional regulator [Hyphomicrobiaceae bacterium]|nr:MAG: LysR family transcriptional regulator [Hyphomicrobiaceae bacterium]